MKLIPKPKWLILKYLRDTKTTSATTKYLIIIEPKIILLNDSSFFFNAMRAVMYPATAFMTLKDAPNMMANIIFVFSYFYLHSMQPLENYTSRQLLRKEIVK